MIKSLREISRIVFPKNKIELLLLTVTFLSYFSFSLYIVFSSSILDNPLVWFDRYFSFDNPTLFFLGIENLEGHPLLIILTYPILQISKLIIIITGTLKAKVIFITFVCCLMISLSVLYVYKYLVDIIKLKYIQTLPIVLFYIFSSTNLILCFTFESFTFSAFALTFFCYYYSLKISRKEPFPILLSIITPIILGGITITNFGKGIVYLIFSQNRTKLIIKTIIASTIIFLAILFLIDLEYNIIDKIAMRRDTYTGGSFNLYKNIVDWFIGSPILFPDIITIVSPVEEFNGQLIIVADYYNQIWQYLFIGLIVTPLIILIAKNITNRLILMLAFLWLSDISLHVILQYGISDPFIYGGHWIYIIPLLLGWMYKKTPEKHIKRYNFILYIAISVLIVNNCFYLMKFITLSSQIFPPI